MRTIKTAIAIILITMTGAACGNHPSQHADVRTATDEELLDQKMKELRNATEFIDKLWKERRKYLNNMEDHTRTIIRARQDPNTTLSGESIIESWIEEFAEKAVIVDNALLPQINKALETIEHIDNLMRKTHSKEDYDYLMINLQEMRKTLEMRKKKITQKKF